MNPWPWCALEDGRLSDKTEYAVRSSSNIILMFGKIVGHDRNFDKVLNL